MLAVSTILSLALLYQDNRGRKHNAECSTLTDAPAIEKVSLFAKPVEDTKIVYKLGDIVREVSQTHFIRFVIPLTIKDDFILHPYLFYASHRAVSVKCITQHTSMMAKQWH